MPNDYRIYRKEGYAEPCRVKRRGWLGVWTWVLRSELYEWSRARWLELGSLEEAEDAVKKLIEKDARHKAKWIRVWPY